MKKRTLCLVMGIFFVAGAAVPVSAQTASDTWEFEIAPLYLWATSIDGTMTLRGRLDQDFGVDFKDAFENLETAFTVHFEAGKGRWGLMADAMYLDLSGAQAIPTPGGEADIGVENLLVEGAAGYSFAESWWVIAGVRYFSFDSDIGFQLDIAPEIEVDESWTDLFAGLLWRPRLGDRWTLSGRFDIGAGGSNLVWNAVGVIDYRLGKWASVFAGYRYLDYDYDNQDNGVELDMSLGGPLVGFNFFW